MTRVEAIAILGGFKYNPLFNEQHFEAFDVAISALSENKGEWIPVSERLPEEEQEVLCQLSDDSCAVLYMQDNWGQMEWVDGQMGTGTYDVIAWQPLPEHYKAESEDKE
jgi:hypothetical protein